MSARKKVALAVCGSVIINLGLVCAVAVLASLWPKSSLARNAAPIRVSLMREPPKPPPPEPLLLSKPPPPPVAQTLERQRVDKPPEDAAFQSDKNTEAKSELPANGDAPIPAQEGKDLPVMSFQTQNYVAGEKPADEAGQGQPSQPVPPQPTPVPMVQRAETSPPLPKVNRKAPRPPEPKPTPLANAVASAPTPLPTAKPDEFALLKPSPTPEPQPSPSPDDLSRDTEPPNPTPALELARAHPQRPMPRPAAQGGVAGYRPQTVKTRLTGGVGPHGVSSIGARDTPLGRYHKAICDAIGSRWYFYTQQRADLIPIGMVRVNFIINSRGQVQHIRVMEGQENGSLATVSIEALTDAKIPPIPPEVASTLEDNQLEITFSFAML